MKLTARCTRWNTRVRSRLHCACRVILPAYGAGPYLPAIVMERPMYVRETSDGLYSPLTYLLYKVPKLARDSAQTSRACLPAAWLHACGTQDTPCTYPCMTQHHV